VWWAGCPLVASLPRIPAGPVCAAQSAQRLGNVLGHVLLGMLLMLSAGRQPSPSMAPPAPCCAVFTAGKLFALSPRTKKPASRDSQPSGAPEAGFLGDVVNLCGGSCQAAALGRRPTRVFEAPKPTKVVSLVHELMLLELAMEHTEIIRIR